jgi:signal transduction histidine kinase
MRVGSRTTKSLGKGTGLGLSISFDIIQQKYNGQLSVITEEGKFTEFVVAIPLR